MKKLAIICASLSRGGAERVAIYLSKYMVDNEIETTIVTACRKENEYTPLAGVGYFCLDDKIKNKNKILRIFYQIKQLRLFLKDSHTDTVLIMGVPLCIYGMLGCLGTKVKVVVSERNAPENFAGKPMVKCISRFLMRFANGFVFQTNDAKKFYDKKLKGRGCVIPNPLLVEQLPQPYEGKRDKTIVTAGRLEPQKNQKLLIEAFSKISDCYPEYNLIIYGEGNLKEKLIKQTEELDLGNRISFPGNLSDLLLQIRKASLFVLTSNFEGMPNALIEAMAIGLPCISTDCPCGGPRELICNGENGVLFQSENIEELIESMKRILDDEFFARKLGKNAQNVRKILDMEVVGKQWFLYLNSLE